MNTLHANFNGGELTPLMAGRFDTEKLRSGCATLKNFIVRPYGGVFKRPGTQFAGRVKTSADSTRCIAFKRSTSTNYILEIGDFYIRFWKGGTTPSQVSVSSVAAWAATTAYVVGDIRSSGGTNYYCKTAHTSGGSFSATNWYALSGFVFEIPTPWAKADVFGLQFRQINDVMFFTHPNYLPYRLSRFAETNWALELVPFTFAPTLDVNSERTTVKIEYNVSVWVTGTAYTVGSRVVGIDATANQLYTCISGHTANSGTQPGVGAGWATVWVQSVNGSTITSWATGTGYSVGNVRREEGVIYTCSVAHTSSAFTRPGIGFNWANFWTITSTDFDLGTINYTLKSSSALFTSSDVGNIWQVEIGALEYFRRVDLWTATPDISAAIFMQGDMLITTNWSVGNGPVGTLFLEISNDMANWVRIREWRLNNVNDGNISHTETAPSTGAYYRIGTVFTTAAQAGNYMKLEAISNSVKVPFLITSYTSTTSVVGTVTMPGSVILPYEAVGVNTTLFSKPAFSSTSGYPRTVAFHGGRLWFGGTSSNPGRIWGSEIDDFYSFLGGVLDTSAIDRTLAAQESNEIRWMTSRGKTLVIGTTGEEWTVDSGDTDSVLTSKNMRARRHTNNGSNGIPAELISDALLIVARGGRRVHEFAYQFSGDQFNSPDMNVLGEHITQGGIVQMAYQSTPDPILWCVIGNGMLAGFSYNREQQITAWHRHLTGEDAGDSFESVATIYGANVSDEVWFVVKRTIGGATVRNIERFDPAAFQWNTEQSGTMDGKTWLDCASTGVLASTVVNSGANCNISGFTSLNGRSVRMLAGLASPASSAVVSAGAATFTGYNATAATNPVIGLPIESVAQAMPLDVMLQDGTSQGRHWEPRRVQFMLNQSLGGTYSDSPSSTFYAIQYPDSTTTPYTGRVREHIPSAAGGVSETTFAIKHSDPYPFGMLGYILTSEVER